MPKISVASIETIGAAWASYAAYSSRLIPARELEEFRQVFYDGFGIALVMLHESADLEKSEKLQKEYFNDCLLSADGNLSDH